MRKRLIVFAPGVGEIGGAARQTRHLLGGFAANGWRILVVARAGSYSRFHLDRSRGYTILEVPGFRRRRLGAILYVACALPIGLFMGFRAGAFIAIQLYSQALVGGFCAAITRKPFVAWTTTSGPLSESTFIRESRIGPLRRMLLRQSTSIVAQTELAESELLSIMPADKIKVIPNPVPLPADPGVSGLPKAMYAGRYARGKNIERLLDAWEEVVDQISDARLTLIGLTNEPGSVEGIIRDRVRDSPKLSRSVSLEGWVEDLAGAMRAHDVYVFPSLTEGMSNSLLDASAWRRIIVASDIAPNRAVLGDEYPLLFDPTSTVALRDQIVAAFSDHDVRLRSREHIETQLSKFSVPIVVKQWEELLTGG